MCLRLFEWTFPSRSRLPYIDVSTYIHCLHKNRVKNRLGSAPSLINYLLLGAFTRSIRNSGVQSLLKTVKYRTFWKSKSAQEIVLCLTFIMRHSMRSCCHLVVYRSIRSKRTMYWHVPSKHITKWPHVALFHYHALPALDKYSSKRYFYEFDETYKVSEWFLYTNFQKKR